MRGIQQSLWFTLYEFLSIGAYDLEIRGVGGEFPRSRSRFDRKRLLIVTGDGLIVFQKEETVALDRGLERDPLVLHFQARKTANDVTANATHFTHCHLPPPVFTSSD